jgi:hypothetical protein
MHDPLAAQTVQSAQWCQSQCRVNCTGSLDRTCHGDMQQQFLKYSQASGLKKCHRTYC